MSANEEIIPHWKGIFNIISWDEAEISRRGGKGPERGDLHFYCIMKIRVNAIHLVSMPPETRSVLPAAWNLLKPG